MYDVGKKETIGSLVCHLFMPSVVLAMQLVGSLDPVYKKQHAGGYEGGFRQNSTIKKESKKRKL